ncbi:polysaccharide deacetylase family sporulation protein PdaB [Lachnospiraceae bacterium XBB1006]|nr:polysaccharide deacetylase family sporulation protein PdaB [Lachnospiraceae bacterium XBB1006]
MDVKYRKERKKGRILLSGMVIAGVLAVGVKKLPATIAVSQNMGARQLPVYSVKTGRNLVALSFDAAWGDEDTGQILKILKRHKVNVTFFATGGWIKQYPEAVKQVLKDGHELGNHSESHPHLTTLSKEGIRQELMRPHQRVKKLTGYEMKVFRPPYGDYNNLVIATARECGYLPIQWSVDSLDWKDYGKQAIVDTVLHSKNLKAGAIILCHNGAKYTASALEELLDGLEKAGFQIVPVSKLVIRSHYRIDGNGMQIPLREE